MKYTYPKVTKKPDRKPNVTVYTSMYYINKRKFKDLEPIYVLPNDTILGTCASLEPITLYAKVVFNDTGTVYNIRPAHLDTNDQYQLNTTRTISFVNCEQREGKIHRITI